MLCDNAMLAGLPQFAENQYTQNVSESANSMLKNWMGFKEKDVDAFILELKEPVTREEDDVARALTGIDSSYEVLEAFGTLVSKSEEYLVNPKLSEEERSKRKAKIINRDFSNVLSQVEGSRPLGGPSQSKDNESLEAVDMSKVDELAVLKFSEPMICGIKEKAKNLIGGGFVTRAFSRNKSRFVKSSSSKKPHLVQTHKKFGYSCDESCLQYKANKVCSHTVATACDNNQLEEHINCLLKARPDPSLDALASGRLDAGKKKGKKRKRVRKTSPAQAYVSRVL